MSKLTNDFTTITSIISDVMFGPNEQHDNEQNYDNVSVSFLRFDEALDDKEEHSMPPRRGGSTGGGTGSGGSRQWLKGEVTIPLYSIIFVLATVGNLLVILTLAQNRRMRTITNVYLLNLSVSDLLLAVFCMPFTLIPTLMQDFVFGHTMCILVRYMQGVSVGVCVFTLVTISMERYFAINQPLRSRRWQTLEHSYKTIVAIWFVSLAIMIPTAICQRIVPLNNGAQKCTEVWEDSRLEKAYTIFLDLVLLVTPMQMMLCAYGTIAVTLYRGIKTIGGGEPQNSTPSHEMRHLSTCEEVDTDDDSRYVAVVSQRVNRGGVGSSVRGQFGGGGVNGMGAVGGGGNGGLGRIGSGSPTRGRVVGAGGMGGGFRVIVPRSLRVTGNPRRAGGIAGGGGMRMVGVGGVRGRSASNAHQLCGERRRRRSIKMLFAVVLEFFVCWTPLYVLQTWRVFDDRGAINNVSAAAMNLVHLLAFLSSCSNPITYCFMSKRFRQCFVSALCRCCRFRSGSGAGVRRRGRDGGKVREVGGWEIEGCRIRRRSTSYWDDAGSRQRQGTMSNFRTAEF